jgi:hypothetical protein
MRLLSLSPGERAEDGAISTVTWQVAGFSALLALLIFVSTLQVTINGSPDPYTTDVGEIQNALARWGTIHFTGYPLYTAIGSALVTGLRLIGIPPAAGASLYSALWGAIAIGLLTWVMLELRISAVVAVVTSLLFAVSTSFWIDASLAELHTMTMAITFGSLLVALRFYRYGHRGDFLWLAFLVGQGVAHQRAFVFSLPALAVLALPRWRLMMRHWLPAAGLVLLGPLTYLYLPIVDWLGSDWTFSNPGTWDGFWALVLDTKTERIIEVPTGLSALGTRLRGIAGTLNDDWPWPMWAGGLLGLTFLGKQISRLERWALALSWIPYLVLSVFIWVGFIGDALLAAKLPVIAMAAVGLGFIGQALADWRPNAGRLAVVGAVVLIVVLYGVHRPAVVAITRDDSAAATIAVAERIPQSADGRPATLMALWGNDYWQLAYAHAYENGFPHLNLVDHNANLAKILERGDHLYTLSRTFYERPLSWWEERLGAISLSSVAPDVVEVRRPVITDGGATDPAFTFENGVTVEEATLRPVDEQQLLLTVVWQAPEAGVAEDYSVAVHLVAADPPAGPDDILAQADSAHPVHGWYPTSRWRPNALIQDSYLLEIPAGSEPLAVRVGMYQTSADGQFLNAGWYSLPVPQAES